MQQLPELETNLKFMAERWRAPAGINPAAELDEYRRVLSKLPQHAVRRGLEHIKGTKTGREWPTPAEVAKAAQDSQGKAQGGITWQDLEYRWDQRWKEADTIMAELQRTSACPQILAANDLGFWRQFRIVARRVIYERLLDEQDPRHMPLLSVGLFEHTRDKHLGEVSAAAWQKQHLEENSGKYRKPEAA